MEMSETELDRPCRASKRRKVEKDTQDLITCCTHKLVDISTASMSEVDLSDDAWLLVFRYLGVGDQMRIPHVCRRWTQLAQTSWKSIKVVKLHSDGKSKRNSKELFKFYRALTDNFMDEMLQRCGASLQCLELRVDTTIFSDRVVSVIGRHCPRLQKLFLTHIGLHDKALMELGEKFPRLRWLGLRCCIRNEDAFGVGLEKLQSLEALHVFNSDFTGASLKRAPHSLKVLNFHGCPRLTPHSMCHLARRCPDLKILDVSGCCFTGEIISHIAKGCLKLKVFSFRECWDKRNKVLPSHYPELAQFPLLEELDFNGRSNVTDAVFFELGRHCHGLRIISCDASEEITDDAIFHLSSCTHLEQIELSSSHITDRGLTQLSLAHPELKIVNLGMYITDEGVIQLLSTHPNLLQLHLSSHHVTDELLAALEPYLQQRDSNKPPLAVIIQYTGMPSERIIRVLQNTPNVVLDRDCYSNMLSLLRPNPLK